MVLVDSTFKLISYRHVFLCISTVYKYFLSKVTVFACCPGEWMHSYVQESIATKWDQDDECVPRKVLCRSLIVKTNAPWWYDNNTNIVAETTSQWHDLTQPRSRMGVLPRYSPWLKAWVISIWPGAVFVNTFFHIWSYKKKKKPPHCCPHPGPWSRCGI